MSHPYNPAGARVGLCGVCGQHFTHEDHYLPTDPVTPATDEEVERLREQARDSRSVIASHALMLIARIDAERAARERAEEDAQHAREESISAFDAAATHSARAERAEGLLREFADEENWQDCLWCAGSGVDRQDHKHQMRCGVCQGRLKTFYDDAADEKSGGILGRARAALSQEKEGGK